MIKHRERNAKNGVSICMSKDISRCLEGDTTCNLYNRLVQAADISLAVAVIILTILWLVQSHDWTYEDEPIVDHSSLPEELKWGHDGQGVKINSFNLSEVQANEFQDGLKRYGYNTFVSDRIPLRRSLPDTRSRFCRRLRTNLTLKASVIVTYHNEAWSTLMRTIFSILDRSEPHLLKELIIVDDSSSHPRVAGRIVKNYLVMFPKVKVMQLDVRRGTWQARMKGAEEASGDILVFLHARCECTDGWLTPLVARLQQDFKVVAVPTVDTINPFNFKYQKVKSVGDIQVGSFTWDLEKTGRLPKNSYSHEGTSLPSPIVKDGIMAVSRRVFSLVKGPAPWQEELERDLSESDDLDDVHFSFKAWMCGGSIEIIPCSHIGLVSRMSWPYEIPHATHAMQNRMKIAVAEIWMDEFKGHVLDRIKGLRSAGNESILEEHRSFRNHMKCHTFSWYLTHVEDVLRAPPMVSKRGELFHTDTQGLSWILGRNGLSVELYLWRTTSVFIWYFTNTSLLVTDDNLCLAVLTESHDVLLRPCDATETVLLNDKWILTRTGLLYHERSGLCLTVELNDGHELVTMAVCDHTKPTQKWTLLR